MFIGTPFDKKYTKRQQNYIYENLCKFYDLYPSVILFLKYVRNLNTSHYIAFLSRDAFFFYLLYKSMYPELKEKKDYSYIYSSRICLTNKTNIYKKYLQSFLTKKKKMLLIDLYGSGNTFVEFIKYSKMGNVNLLFYIHDRHRLHDKKNLVNGYINTDNKFKMSDDIIEPIFRSYHDKVTNLTNNFKPIFTKNNGGERHGSNEKKRDISQKYWIKIYRNTIKYMKYNRNIRYLTISKFKNKIKINNEINKKYNWLLALDIDDTITNVADYKYIRNTIKICQNKSIKIILVTARPAPFVHGSKNNMQISPIIPILHKINYNFSKKQIDIWYNPYSFVHDHVGKIKYQQIQENIKSYNIKKKNVIFYDDNVKTIEYCRKQGIKSILIKKGTGFDKSNLDTFMNFIRR